MNMQALLAQVAERVDLTEDQAAQAVDLMISGEASPAQIGAWLMALRGKGETVDEIAGCARAMRARAVAVPHAQPLVVDTAGTGGDRSGTFNISTAAAFAIAGAGVAVAKHGNRGVSGPVGSADVLEALGIPIHFGPAEVARCIDEVGLGFMFAPLFHPATKQVAQVRKEIGLRTIFNILGPLTNPAGAQAQVVGVPDAGLTDPMARVLGRLGVRRALVVHGLDGLDELTVSGPSQVSECRQGAVSTYQVTPEAVGLRPSPREALQGGSAAENARIILAILGGERGPRHDVVALNAGAALLAAGRVDGLAAGVRLASAAITAGRAQAVFDRLRRLSEQLAGTARVM